MVTISCRSEVLPLFARTAFLHALGCKHDPEMRKSRRRPRPCSPNPRLERSIPSAPHVLPSVGCAHLALKPRVLARCAFTGQEVSGVLQPSHICIRSYTYMLTARAVYVVRYPTLLEWTSRFISWPGHREIRVCRTKGGERGGLTDWCLLIILSGQVARFSLDVLNSMHADILPHRSAHLALLAWAKLSSTCGQGDVGSMPAQPGIQSVIKRQAVTNYWASLNSALANGHSP